MKLNDMLIEKLDRMEIENMELRRKAKIRRLQQIERKRNDSYKAKLVKRREEEIERSLWMDVAQYRERH